MENIKEKSTPNKRREEIHFPHDDSPSISHFIAFLTKLKLKKIISKNVSDPRVVQTSTYPLHSILLSALGTVLFQRKSKHSFQSSAHQSSDIEAKFAKFFCSKNDKLPVTRTIDDVLDVTDYEELNHVLFDLFEEIRLSKLFFNHEELCPDGYYHIAIDGETVHKYVPESAHDAEHCPFCLKRQHGEAAWYLHNVCVASLVCPGGFRLPLYVYPVHAKNTNTSPGISEEAMKQECELSAFPIIIRAIRERFPRLRMCALLDSLYANGPAFELLKANKFEYIIVLKKGSLPSVVEECDELEAIGEYQRKYRVAKRWTTPQHQKVRQEATFFDLEYKENQIHVLRFDEVVLKSNRTPHSKCHWEWILSEKIRKKNALKKAARGRLRWLEEDEFNTVENRGFAMHHDYSRKSMAQAVWVVLIMIAFFITQVFVHTRNMIKARKNVSIKEFMCDLFYQLRYMSLRMIFTASVLFSRVQFRFEFHRIPERPP